MKCLSISLLCGLFLVSACIIANAPAPLMAQVDKQEGNKKIVVIFKGGSKDPAAKLSVDDKEQGTLAPEKFIEISVGSGGHTVVAGEGSSRSVRCSRSLSGSSYGTSSTSFDHIDVSFNPATLKVDLSASDTIYLLVERFKPPTIACEELERSPDKFSEYKVREIKAEEGQKLVKKYSK